MISNRAQSHRLHSVTHPLTGVYDDPNTLSADTAAFMAKLDLKVIVAYTPEFITVLFDACHPDITDAVSATAHGLWANFHTFTSLTLERVMRQDDLWQDHCFECFIAADPAADSAYLEINLATNGAFNLYHFKGYRTPQKMPPPRLAANALTYGDELNFFNQALSQTGTHPVIFWQTASEALRHHVHELANAYPLTQDTFRVGMTVATAALNRLFGADNCYAINPTRVIKPRQPPDDPSVPGLSYWAVTHAEPADFHDKAYWLTDTC